MHTTRYLTVCIALLAVAATTADRPARAGETKETPLIQVLQSDSPKKDKAITCKRLAIYGTSRAVPALAALLPDPELTSWARIALEAIPGPEADQALRDAMDKVQGRTLIGVINSIGVRRDASAVDQLAAKLKDRDAQVAVAAAVALGRIGNDRATRVLQQSLAGAPAAVRSAIAEGCIYCAERLLAEGNEKAAAKVYDQVRNADVPKQRIVEATRGAILAGKSAGVELLVEQLQSADKVMFALGLSAARELPGPAVTEALVAQLGQIRPDRQARLLGVLADRRDPAALPAVVEIAETGSKPARIAAIGVLRRMGNATCVPVLLSGAVATDAELAEAAIEALEGLPGEGVNKILVSRLREAEGKARPVLIELAGRRRIQAATPALWDAADAADSRIRTAALTALGATIQPGDLGRLIQRAVAPKKVDDRQAAEQAVRVAALRMPDREACAQQLTASLSRASVPAKCAILDILGAMGGTNALAAVAAAAKDENPQLRDTASQLLGRWMTADAAPVLLEVAKTAPQAKYRVRALRGYIRIARQFVVPDPQRAAMCRAALDAAERDTEKKLVLKVIERYPSVDMLKVAVEAAKDPELKDAAVEVALEMAKKLGNKAPEVKQLLDQIQ